MSQDITKDALPAGTRLKGANGIYTVERVLGSGGFGITYLVSSKMLLDGMSVKAHFALKEYFPKEFCERTQDGSLSCMASNRERITNSRKDFVSEARRLQQVASMAGDANVVRVREVFEANGTAYYVMEYLEGPTLAQYLREHGTLSESQALDIISKVIDTVSTLHANRLTHLDIKPANIILTTADDGSMRPVLIDFGLSKHYDVEGNATSTLNTVGCTPGYAPIEQYSGLRKFSPQSDIYALAATFMYLITGKTPPAADVITPEDIANSLRGLASGRTIAAVQHAMRYARNERTASAESFASELGAQYSESTVSMDDTVSNYGAFNNTTGNTSPISKGKPSASSKSKPTVTVDSTAKCPLSRGWLIAWIVVGLVALFQSWYCYSEYHYFFSPMPFFIDMAILTIASAAITRYYSRSSLSMSISILLICIYTFVRIKYFDFSFGSEYFSDQFYSVCWEFVNHFASSYLSFLLALPVFALAINAVSNAFLHKNVNLLFILIMVLFLLVLILGIIFMGGYNGINLQTIVGAFVIVTAGICGIEYCASCNMKNILKVMLIVFGLAYPFLIIIGLI